MKHGRLIKKETVNSLASIVLIFTLFVISAIEAKSEQCDNLPAHALMVEEIYSTSNICAWIAEELKYGDQCSGTELSGFKNNSWDVFVSTIRTFESGFMEREVSIAGPGKYLSGQFRVGFERLVVRIMVFYSEKCVEVPYIYLRLALGNPRNIDELTKEGGNTTLFDPAEGWEGQVKKTLERAIRAGVQKEISQLSE